MAGTRTATQLVCHTIYDFVAVNALSHVERGEHPSDLPIRHANSEPVPISVKSESKA